MAEEKVCETIFKNIEEDTEIKFKERNLTNEGGIRLFFE